MLEANANTAADHSLLTREPDAALFAGDDLLEVKEVASVNYGLCLEWEAEIRKRLSDEDAQTWIVDREPTLEWVNSKYRRLGRKAKDRANARARF